MAKKKNPFVFLDVSIGRDAKGRMVFEVCLCSWFVFSSIHIKRQICRRKLLKRSRSY